MSRPNKVRYSGVALMANGYTLSRVQTLSVDTDLGEEEARELSNEEVVEYTATNPQVTVQVETNEYGSCRNLRAVASVTGGASITQTDFDGTSTDLVVAVEEDGVFTRSMLVNDAFLTSLSLNYDAGGVATETFNWEADNKSWYANTTKEIYSIIGISSYINAGTVLAFVPIATGYSAFTATGLYVDGIRVSGTLTHSGYALLGISGLMVSGYDATWADVTTESYAYDTNGVKPSAMPRVRGVFYRTTANTAIPITTSRGTAQRGSIPRGKLDIWLATGGEVGYGSNNSTNFLRLQSVSIDVDLSREIINELGHYRSVERSLIYPIPVNLTFSALSSDMTEWAKFSSLPTTENVYTLTSFTKTCALQVRIFNKNDTDTTRVMFKSVTITGMQIVGEAFGVDVGGNATQDFTAKASNFLIAGSGIPGVYPASHGGTFSD